MNQLARVLVPDPETEIIICDEGDASKPWMPPKYTVIANLQPRPGVEKPEVRRAWFRAEDDMFEAFDELQLKTLREWKSIRASLISQFQESQRQARRKEISHSGEVQRIYGTHISELENLRRGDG
ncbi:MAG TPA: hypothetical protein VK760_16395 [Candidatus Acidoferrales bacterium]|jgi:hypothetical protein|nr:hypothetical protein [Candidatus Acidoferrales bacterium]